MAEAQANEMDAWWRAHPEKAPALFARELAEACEVIATTPTVGTTYSTAGGTHVRRVRLPKTRNHLYFEVDAAAETVVVLMIWGSPRGEGPEL